MISLYCPRCSAVLAHPAEDSPLYQCFVCCWVGHPKDARKEPEIKPRPRLPYISIDLETTGLDPDTCQILEIGVIFDDWTNPVDTLPIFHAYVCHPIYQGDPYALALNARILKRLSGQHDKNVLCPENVGPALAAWLATVCGWDTSKCLTPAGKNFASMDLQFLRKLPGFTKSVKLTRRCIDPAVLYWRPSEDEELPGTKLCMERAGIGGNVAHDAVADADVVVKLVRRAVCRLDGMSR